MFASKNVGVDAGMEFVTLDTGICRRLTVNHAHVTKSGESHQGVLTYACHHLHVCYCHENNVFCLTAPAIDGSRGCDFGSITGSVL